MVWSGNKNTKKIPDIVIEERLPKYLRALTRMQENGGVERVSSEDLGKALNYSAAQIRKDLSYFGRFGKQGQGYDVKKLVQRLREILGLENKQWNMALVGVGGLGRAIVGYGRFAPQGFKIVAAFDHDPAKVGKKVGTLVVKDMKELGDTIKRENIQIGIVAVPASAAQQVIERLEEAGVKAILNYAPITAPRGKAKIQDIDPVLKLQSMTYYLKQDDQIGKK
ncbi:MAG: redox-sensing transcriptional repressor Rex [Chloroflexi bacterium]|nr:redox-sensing transcriptional repressor Rex [Chloroflexota bacterium]